jgi:hypothetical protein
MLTLINLSRQTPFFPKCFTFLKFFPDDFQQLTVWMPFYVPFHLQGVLFLLPLHPASEETDVLKSWLMME